MLVYMTIDAQKQEELLSRSIKTIYPSKEALSEVLATGKKLRIYTGIDPTADYVHLGHSTNYIILKRLHELGHKIIVLIGDFTAMIGDPSDKTSLRKKLTREDVVKNLQTFKEQIGKILDFENKENPIEFKFNNDWLAPLTFEQVIELASHFTVQQMIQRDAFEKRLTEEKPLYVHEFFYPLMQGYDSVALDADLEIGGTDQTFNMLAGRTLVKAIQQKEKFVITTTLLENPITGEKLMSKSLGTGVGLNEDAISMYQKVMKLPDEGVIQCFVDCTYMALADIGDLKNQLEEGMNPRDLKMKLAYTIVTMYHSSEEAEKAQVEFVNVFQKDLLPEHVEEIKAEGRTFSEVIIQNNILPSNSELRRLAEVGAISHVESKKVISFEDIKKAPETGTYKIGKNRFIKIT